MFDIQNRSEYLIVANVTKSGVKYNCVCNLGDFHVIFLTDEELSEKRDKLGVAANEQTRLLNLFMQMALCIYSYQFSL